MGGRLNGGALLPRGGLVVLGDGPAGGGGRGAGGCVRGLVAASWSRAVDGQGWGPGIRPILYWSISVWPQFRSVADFCAGPSGTGRPAVNMPMRPESSHEVGLAGGLLGRAGTSICPAPPHVFRATGPRGHPALGPAEAGASARIRLAPMRAESPRGGRSWFGGAGERVRAGNLGGFGLGPTCHPRRVIAPDGATTDETALASDLVRPLGRRPRAAGQSCTKVSRGWSCSAAVRWTCALLTMWRPARDLPATTGTRRRSQAPLRGPRAAPAPGHAGRGRRDHSALRRGTGPGGAGWSCSCGPSDSAPVLLVRPPTTTGAGGSLVLSIGFSGAETLAGLLWCSCCAAGARATAVGPLSACSACEGAVGPASRRRPAANPAHEVATAGADPRQRRAGSA